MKEYRVSQSGRAYRDGKEIPSFGTLLDQGVLYKSVCVDADGNPMWIDWTVREHCKINGVEAQVGDVIQWEKFKGASTKQTESQGGKKDVEPDR